MGLTDGSGFDHPCLCAACRQGKWIFDQARAGFIFDGTVREAIHMMKYQGHFGLGSWLGRKMTEALQDTIHNDPDEGVALIIPVPLSSERFREREFNHAFAIAKSLSRLWNIPVCPSVLERKPGSKPQVGLTPRERWSNVRGAFKVKNPGLVG
jgi:predicted amidophosphoribosyltransferase